MKEALCGLRLIKKPCAHYRPNGQRMESIIFVINVCILID